METFKHDKRLIYIIRFNSCPHCGEDYFLSILTIKKNKEIPWEAHILCQSCGNQGPIFYGKSENEARNKAIFEWGICKMKEEGPCRN